MKKILILITLLMFSLQITAFANKQADDEFRLGVKAHQANDLFRAIDHYSNAIKLDPKMKNAYFLRGLIYANYSDKEKGIVDFTTAINLDSNDANCYNERAKAYLANRQIEKAIADFEKALTFKADNFDCYNGLGGAYKELKQFDKALAYYSKSIELSDKEPYVYYNRGLVYHQTEQYQKALADFITAIDKIPPQNNMKPNEKDYYETLYREAIFEKAVVLDRLSRTEEALAAYKDYINHCGFDHYTYKEFAAKRIKELSK